MITILQHALLLLFIPFSFGLQTSCIKSTERPPCKALPETSAKTPEKDKRNLQQNKSCFYGIIIAKKNNFDIISILSIKNNPGSCDKETNS